MTTEADRQPKPAPLQRGVRFDPTINLGHIITFVGFILSLVVTNCLAG